MRLPDGVLGMARRGPDWAGFVDGLPGTLADLLEQWQLRVDGLPMHGFVALVVPVTTESGEPAVLKISFADEESEHEHLALKQWAGNGAVRLLRADPSRQAMLLERAGPTKLAVLEPLAACEVVAGLYGRIHLPAPPQLRALTSYVARWTDGLSTLPRGAAVPRRLVEQAVSLGRDFADDPESRGVLVHGDLHYDNVLAAEREPWLVIDPKPLSGDPHYELAPMLWNRFYEVVGDVRSGVRRRFHTLVDDAELDEDRARDWVVVRMVHSAVRRIRDAESSGDPLDSEWLTRCVAIAKAVQH